MRRAVPLVLVALFLALLVAQPGEAARACSPRTQNPVWSAWACVEVATEPPGAQARGHASVQLADDRCAALPEDSPAPLPAGQVLACQPNVRVAVDL